MTSRNERVPPAAAELSNGPIALRVYLPDAASGFYRGTRFDWSGVIASLTCGGHEYYGPWFTDTDPAVRDFIYDGDRIVAGPASAVTGPAEEFSTDGLGLGYRDAEPGGTFIKIGVGVLRKPQIAAAYDRFQVYEIVDPGRWTVAAGTGAIDFTHTLDAPRAGYGYEYTKTLRLAPGAPRLTIAHGLRNRGARAIVGSVYNHNFLVLDPRSAGPGPVLTTPFALRTPRPLDPALAVIRGRELAFTRPLRAREVVSTPLEGFGATAADYRFDIEYAGAGVTIHGDRPLASLALWSIRSVLAVEPFIAMSIPPGGELTWQYDYRYYSV